MRLTEDQKEKLRTLTVEILIDLRRQAQRAGWNPLDLWDQLAIRARAATNTSQNPAEWTSEMLRKLRLSAPSRDSSASLTDLSATAREWGAETAWLDLLAREHSLLIAHARKIHEDRQAAALAAKNNPTPETDHV